MDIDAANVRHMRDEISEAQNEIKGTPTYQGSITQETLLALLDMPNLEEVDLEHIMRTRELLPTDDRERAEQLVRSRKFQDWVVAPASRELLVHGDLEGTHYVSALSFLCSTLIESLKEMNQFLPLIFFCGRHVDDNDVHAGGRGMIKSLIAQLLRQRSFDTSLLDREVNISLVKEGDIKQLSALFGWLAHQLAEDVTLFCFIDGIKYYERDQYSDDMGEVLRSLLDLTEDRNMHNTFKILVTSPSETKIVRQAFDNECILSMAGQPRTGTGFSKSRVGRQLEGAFV
jgi:hypothetical protein